MRPSALGLLLLAGACQAPVAAPAASVAPKPTSVEAPQKAPSPVWTAAQKGCIEQYLEAHGLDGFGSPRGSMYPGGTPLFDEASGQRLSREEYLAQRHPDILHACGM
jgi:hypothetical protein